jgi:hypothetical protein
VAKGLVNMNTFADSKSRFCNVYVLTPTSMTKKVATIHHFLQRKMDEYEALTREIEALESEVDEDQVRDLRKVNK